MPSFTLETEANGQSTQVGDPLPSLAAARRRKPTEALTVNGVAVRVEARTSQTRVVMHVGIQQFEFDATQARLAARLLRLAAATVDPDPVEV